MPLTRYTLLDRHNPDPTARSSQREAEFSHEWHNLRRGDRMPGHAPNVIIGFKRMKGGIYGFYGPDLDHVCGWSIIKASVARSPQARAVYGAR